MFGITTPDAVLIGTLIVSLLAAWKGSQRGESAKSQDPDLPMTIVGSTLADTLGMRSQTEATIRLAEAMERVADSIGRHLQFEAEAETAKQRSRIERLLARFEEDDKA